jgi:acyl-CoA thioester hydrolase
VSAAPKTKQAAPVLPAPLYRGSVNTWECDQNGHLNVRFQCERATAGLAQMAAALGMRGAFRADAGATLAPLDLHVRFLREAHPLDPLVMHGGVLSFEQTGASLCLDMRHGDGAPGTSFCYRVAHVEPHTLKPFPWSSHTRAAAKQLGCALPTHSTPRAIDVNRPLAEANLARAKTLGASLIGAHLVTPDQCDAFGRLRPEHIFGRASDSVPSMFAEWRTNPDAGGLSGAVVEARIAFRRWPRAGDLIEVHSGIIEAQGKITRIVHWMLDPVRGKCWASMEVVAVAFDLTTRKAVDMPPALLEARRKQIVVGMAI